ncbi:hypothetical protein, partial [Nonomuraea sp. NPDC005501]|uniref:hypothetical protein n=1 Tax=Nonomuraea sp. NPDC005501 TaxID=3156884 RepID=UPI0033B6FC99
MVLLDHVRGAAGLPGAVGAVEAGRGVAGGRLGADTVLGTGLSCAMRDSRTVCEILLASDDWSH